MSRTNPKEMKMREKRQPLAKPRPLIEYFEDLPDPRMDRSKKHKVVDILVIGLCSQLTGGSGFSDMETFGRIREDWLRTFLELPEGIPSHDTFNRCFAAIAALLKGLTDLEFHHPETGDRMIYTLA